MCENCVCGCLRRRSDQLRLRGVEKNERICQSGLYVKTSRMASKKCAPNYITKKQNGPSHYREWEIPIPLVNMKQLHTQTGKTWVIEIDLWSAMTRIDNVKNQSTREILQSFFFQWTARSNCRSCARNSACVLIWKQQRCCHPTT